MRYWVYINDKVEGPFTEDKLVTLQGFTPDTLICSEDTANSGNQEWVKASNIFEFDQPAPAATSQTGTTSAAADSGLAALLLAKLDALTNQITGLQTKLDGMQTKLDDAITKQQAAASVEQQPAEHTMDGPQANTITLTRHDIEAQVEEVLPPAEEEKPLDMLGPVDLGDNADNDLNEKAGEDVVVSAALDSLYNAQLRNQQDLNENTFQELLTPKQAQKLAATADAALAAHEEQERTLDEALKKVEQNANDPEAKDKLIDSFSTAPQPDVVDQVIQEKEEEKGSSTGAGLAVAGAAALAGAAAFAALNTDKEENTNEEKQPIDLTAENGSDIPALSLAKDPEEPAPTPAETDQPKESKPAIPANTVESDIPSLETADEIPQEAQDDVVRTATGTVQELVPGANLDKPSEELITEEDINEAFAEHNANQDQSVEQLFGLTAANTAEKTSNEITAEGAPVLENLDAPIEKTSSGDWDTTTAAAPTNPNELTEIQLKEGSTYLISDFVPPAQAVNALPKELEGLEKKAPADNDTSATPKEEEETEVQEMVSLKAQTEKAAEAPADAPADTTVSQIILENTIKTKRGASLDIKTVPMVPDPSDSPRLHLEGMDDDLNTQHDVQEADVKPTGKGTKAVIASLIALLLFAVLYALMAFLHLIPQQYNIFSSKTAVEAQQVEQNAQLEEMLAPQDVNSPESDGAIEQEPSQTPDDAMSVILEEVKAYPLQNGYTLKDFIDAKHPAVQEMITWEAATALDPDNYSILVKVPPENPQSFKISYRFNYNAVTKALEPTISDAKNLLDSAVSAQPAAVAQ